jgi:teichuronic acid biosynthesis glycosyltransferase TuaG
LVSVIVLTYNRSILLHKCLQAILNQTHKDIEVVVLDDGSTDDTSSVVRNFKDNRIVYINDGKIGNISMQRNKGIKLSKGDIIAFCDDDDVWFEKKIEIQLKYLKENIMICSNGNVIDANDKIIYKKVNTFKNDIFIDLKILLKNNCVLTSSVLLYKNILIDLGCFTEENEGNKSEDYDLWMRVASKYKIKYINQVLISYRTNSNNITFSSFEYRRKLSFININLISPYLKSNEPDLIKSAVYGLNMEYKNLSILYYKYNKIYGSLYYCKKLLVSFNEKYSIKYLKYISYFIYLLIRRCSKQYLKI